MSRLVVAVDLGKWKCGRAIALDGVLVDCRTISIPRRRGHRPGVMAQALTDPDSLAWELKSYGSEWVCEWPKKYPHQRAKHQNIDDLQAVGKCLRWDKKYSPHAWKGNVAKPAHRARIKRALTPEELAVMPPMADHDAWDACGILLFHLGRVKRGGIKP
jgi:hypothetical protein